MNESEIKMTAAELHDQAQISFEFALSNGVSDYFQEFVDGLNEAQENSDFISDATGETTPQVVVRTWLPKNPGFWTVLFEDVVNGNEDLYIDVLITVSHGDNVLYQTSMENLAIILASPINNGGSVLQFVLFENDDGEEVECEDCED